MLKKFVSSLLVCLLLVGCGSSTTSSTTTTTEENQPVSETTETVETSEVVETTNDKDMETAAKLAEKAVNDLGIEDVEPMETRIINGLMFFDEGLVSGSALYRSTNKAADSVGVFVTNDPEAVKTFIEDYLVSLKAQMESYNPSDVFKIDNAVVESNDNMVVMIISSDIEQAKKEAQTLLN